MLSSGCHSSRTKVIRPSGTFENVSQEQRSPESKTKTAAFLPGQALNIPNRKFRRVEIRAEYPLRIYVGPCHSDYTVDFACNSEPADLFIVDTRRMPVFLTPRSNSVTITVTEF